MTGAVRRWPDEAAGITVISTLNKAAYAVSSQARLKQLASKADTNRVRERRLAGDWFLVVGIGASAGGVEALRGFFEAMPSDPGMAFVVVTHLGAGHESALPQILARSTPLPIAPVHDGATIEPNRIYVLSSDAVPTLRRKRLRLSQQPAGAREHNTIDVFFASLAEDRGEDAVAIILSGTG